MPAKSDKGGRRQPAQILKLKGEDKNHPTRWARRNRDAEIALSKPKGPLTKDSIPEDFPEEMIPTYLEVLDRAHVGVLSYADAGLVEMTARLWYQMRTEGVGDDKAMSKLLSCFDKLGMTPVARGKVAMFGKEEREKDNPLNEFAA